MKRKLVVATLLVVVVLSVTFHSHSRKDSLNDLLLENVEALAGDESPNGQCIGYGSVDCPRGNIKVEYVDAYYSLEAL